MILLWREDKRSSNMIASISLSIVTVSAKFLSTVNSSRVSPLTICYFYIETVSPFEAVKKAPNNAVKQEAKP
jgi:hypothetical protein